MVNLNGVCTKINYEYYVNRQEKTWEKMLEDYANLEYNQDLCDCYRQINNIEPLIANINQNNINQIINKINNYQTLTKMINIILDKYDFSDYHYHINDFDYDYLDDENSNFRAKLYKFNRHYEILLKKIDQDIDDYDYYANKSNFWTWVYWVVFDQPRYLWRSIGNLSNLTLRKCLQKLKDFRGRNICGKGMRSKNYLRDIKNAVSISKLIRDNYLVHLNDQNLAYQRKVQLINDIKEKYHEIYRLLRLNKPMNEN